MSCTTGIRSEFLTKRKASGPEATRECLGDPLCTGCIQHRDCSLLLIERLHASSTPSGSSSQRDRHSLHEQTCLLMYVERCLQTSLFSAKSRRRHPRTMSEKSSVIPLYSHCTATLEALTCQLTLSVTVTQGCNARSIANESTHQTCHTTMNTSHIFS